MAYPPDENAPQPAPEKKSRIDKMAGRLQAWSEHSPLAQKAKDRYERHRRFLPLAFFFGGVAWDGATLRRIDAIGDTIFLLVYLLILGALILIAMLVDRGQMDSAFLNKHEKWYPLFIQFFLGALFSAYFIFYFQSASLTTSSLYMIVLVSLLVANEFLQSRLLNPYLLFTLFFVATASFFIYLIPILVKAMGYGYFLLGCLLSSILSAGMIYLLYRKTVFQIPEGVRLGVASILLPLVLLNVFYLNNWIPPVPISMKEGKVYHSVKKIEGNAYTARYIEPPWYNFWANSDRKFHYAEGDSVFCYTAIFAPTAFDTNVAHQWQWYDESAEAWMDQDRISYTVYGGRDGGFRGFTFKRFVKPGKWRVNVMMGEDKMLGRVPFTIVPADTAVTPTFVERLIE